MIAPETLKKIKQIEINTRRLLNGALVGDTRSAIKGSGFEFDQIREYQQGDDVRFIDWKASARSNKLLVKQYIEERSRCIIIAVDISASTQFASQYESKYSVMAEIASVFSLVAEYSKDSVALLLFSDQIELFLPPNKGRYHVHMLMKQLFEYKAMSKSSSFRVALEHLITLKRRDAIIIMISDFINIQSENGIEKLLYGLGKKSEILAIRCLDRFERSLPNVGFLTVEDLETGDLAMLDTRHIRHDVLRAYLQSRDLEQLMLFKKHGIDCLDIIPGNQFIGDVIRFFRQRMV